MKRYKASGSAYNVDLEQLKLALKLGFPQIRIRPRIYGYDFEFESSDFELYINTTDELVYFITIFFIGDIKELIRKLENLITSLTKATFDFDIGYCEVNDEGNQISEDIYLRKFTPPSDLA